MKNLLDRIYKIQQRLQLIEADGEGRNYNGKTFRFTSLRHLQKVILPLFAEMALVYTSYWDGDLYVVEIFYEDESLKSQIRVNTDQPHYTLTAVTSTYTKNMLMKMLGLVSEAEEANEDEAQVVIISPADLEKAVQQGKQLGITGDSLISQLQRQGYILSEGNKSYIKEQVDGV
jgi:hypothetical protein